MAETQTYANHVRRLPMYYTLSGFVLFLNILWHAWQLLNYFSVGSVLALFVSIALLVAAFAARTQTLTVQNRVIRLEERLRYQAVLPPDLAARAVNLPINQITALRFASDAELAGLVQQVLAGQLSESKDIKQKISNWQGDFLRA